MPDDTEPAPDTSGPAQFGDITKMFTHGVSDPDALMSALKASRMPSIPLSQLGDAAKAGTGMRWCGRCGRPEPENAGCPNGAIAESTGAQKQAFQEAYFPAGSFPHGAPAGTTCASCQSHGVMTLHSPAGEEHKAWEAKWAEDPDWMPDGAIGRLPPMLPVPAGPDARTWPQRWEYSASMEPPADPFPDTDVLAGMGVAQMLDAMEAGGVPPLRAERIIGAMLAAHGLMAKEAGSDEGGA